MKTICIAGKNDIAVNVLEFCLQNYKNYRIVCILNRNESGKNTWQKSLKWFAERYKVEIISLQDAYDIEEMTFISTEFDRIIKPEKFKTDEMYNIHFSLLPKYKGCSPSVLPILFGEEKTGVTLHRIRAGIDTGEIIAQKSFEITDEDTSLDVYMKLIEFGSKVVIDNIDNIIKGQVKAVAQSKMQSTYYGADYIDYRNLMLNTNSTAYQIRNQIRAFAFRPYQLLKYNEHGLVDAKITDAVSEEKPGTILYEDDIIIKMASIDYDIEIYKDTLNMLFDVICENDNEKAKKLCSCKKLVEAQDEHGWSALTVAVYNNNFEMVDYLINKGADIFVTNNNGTNLLMYAKNCYVNTNDATVFEYLMEKGLSPENKDYQGKSLYDYCREENIIKIGKYSMSC